MVTGGRVPVSKQTAAQYDADTKVEDFVFLVDQGVHYTHACRRVKSTVWGMSKLLERRGLPVPSGMAEEVKK